MKCVMLSIQPKWCELIASGEKTVEVRKTKPKIDVPFKCYIYCTKGDNLNYLKSFHHKAFDKFWIDNKAFGCNVSRANGKVIGEFVCDKVVQFENDCYTPAFEETADLSCVGYKGLYDYLGAKEYGYGWHITDLVIYDKPKELSEFRKICQSDYCHTCDYAVKKNGYLVDCDRSVKRPPQSYMFVEEPKGETE